MDFSATSTKKVSLGGRRKEVRSREAILQEAKQRRADRSAAAAPYKAAQTLQRRWRGWASRRRLAAWLTPMLTQSLRVAAAATGPPAAAVLSRLAWQLVMLWGGTAKNASPMCSIILPLVDAYARLCAASPTLLAPCLCHSRTSAASWQWRQARLLPLFLRAAAGGHAASASLARSICCVGALEEAPAWPVCCRARATALSARLRSEAFGLGASAVRAVLWRGGDEHAGATASSASKMAAAEGASAAGAASTIPSTNATAASDGSEALAAAALEPLVDIISLGLRDAASSGGATGHGGGGGRALPGTVAVGAPSIATFVSLLPPDELLLHPPPAHVRPALRRLFEPAAAASPAGTGNVLRRTIEEAFAVELVRRSASCVGGAGGGAAYSAIGTPPPNSQNGVVTFDGHAHEASSLCVGALLAVVDGRGSDWRRCGWDEGRPRRLAPEQLDALMSAQLARMQQATAAASTQMRGVAVASEGARTHELEHGSGCWAAPPLRSRARTSTHEHARARTSTHEHARARTSTHEPER